MKFRIKNNSDDDLDIPEATRLEPDPAEHGFANKWWFIEVNTLEELLALSKRLKYPLIVSDLGWDDEPRIVVDDPTY